MPSLPSAANMSATNRTIGPSRVVGKSPITLQSKSAITGSISPASVRSMSVEEIVGALGVVDMRIGLVEDDDVGGVDQRLVDVGVEVELEADLHVRRRPAPASA